MLTHVIYIFCLIIAIIVSIVVTFIICKKQKIKITTELDTETINLNREIEKENNFLKNIQDGLQNEITIKKQELKEAGFNLEQTKKNAKDAADAFLQSNLDAAYTHFENEMEKLGDKYQNAEEDYQTEYTDLMDNLTEHYVSQELALVDKYKKQEEEFNLKTDDLKQKLNDLQATVDAAIAAAKRKSEEEEKLNFYRLVLSEEDIEEIAALHSIEHQLRDPSVLNKVIWKTYYEKPYTDLIGRVVGPQAKTGIYKITNIENDMSYVGQAANIADRWKQHIKRGIGAEPATKNKLYPAMKKYNVENFTFEIIEECDRKDLDAKEDYWQDFFHCKDYGYSIK